MPFQIVGEAGDFKSFTVTRFVEAPCPISGSSLVVCGNTTSQTYSITPVSNVQGYSYAWTLPTGWSGSTTGTSINVTPNGNNGGTISVVAQAYGMTSSSCTKSISITAADPETDVSGPTTVCEDENETFSLSPTPSSQTSTVWSVSPSYLASPSSGTGSTATFAGTSISGNGTLTFTVTGCNDSDPIPHAIQFNDPVISISSTSGSSAYGSYYYVCPTSGSHYVRVNLTNDSDNCVDLWDDNGTAGSEWWNCLEYDFTLQYNGSNYPPYNTVALDIEASNTSCGADNKQIYFIPSYSACSGGWRLMADPNPANDKVNIKVEYEEDGVKQNVEMEKFELLDFQGNVRIKVKEKKKFLQIKVRDLPQGVYYMKATLGDKILTEPLLIQP